MRKHVWLSALMALSLAAFGCGDDGETMDTDAGVDVDGGEVMMDGGGGEMDGAVEEVNPLVAAIAADPDLDTLEALITKLATTNGEDGEPILDVGLLDSLAEATVFAPNNDALGAALTLLGIADLDSATGEQLQTLYGVLLYHIAPAEWRAADIMAAEPLAARSALVRSVNDLLTGFGGVPYFFDTADGVAIQFLAPDGSEAAATVVGADIDVNDADGMALEGFVIHKINATLLPPDVAAVAHFAGLTSLEVAAQAVEIAEGVSVFTALRDPSATYTVFAPSNEGLYAFVSAAGLDLEDLSAEEAATVVGVLTYHVLTSEVRSIDLPARADALNELTMLYGTVGEDTVINGGSAAMTGANIIGVDILASNGIIHLIDAPIAPLNIAQMAGVAGFSSLLETITAVDEAAGVDDPSVAAAVTNPAAPVTVFAPTNDAFAAATGSGGPAEGASTDVLRQVLLYHATTGNVLSTDLPALDGMAIPTASPDFATGPTVNVGDTITFTDGAGQTITPNVDLLDIKTTTGTIHVIDTVMLPDLT